MSALHPHVRELRSAFLGFKSHAPNASTNSYNCLDACYAVECGLKALVLSEKWLTSTEMLQDDLKTHCLHKLANMCKPPVSHTLHGSVSLKSRSCPPQTIPLNKFHQALRYGIKLSDTEWKKHAGTLDALYETVKCRLKRV